jgi:hypothetical protein
LHAIRGVRKARLADFREANILGSQTEVASKEHAHGTRRLVSVVGGRIMTPATPPCSIFIMAYAECDELDVVGPFAVLQTANRFLGDPARKPLGATFDLRIVAVDGSGAVKLDGPTGRNWS